LADALEESDLRAGLKDGGQVLGAFIVARSEEEFVIYMRASWLRGRGFRIVRTWRGASGDRTFKSLQSAWCFVHKFDFFGRVTVYPAGDVELRQFVGVVPHDLEDPPKFAGSAHRTPTHSLLEPGQPPATVAVPDLVATVHLATTDGNAPVAMSPISAKPPGTSP
jgi:hypothetical protein